MRYLGLAGVAAGALLAVSAASAQNQSTDTSGAADATMQKLQDFKSTGARSLATVPQGGAKAEAIKKNLEAVKLPPGFKISLYALVPDARMIAVGPQGVVTYVSTRKTKIYTITDRTRTGVGDDVRVDPVRA